jgi:hypothetical protein
MVLYLYKDKAISGNLAPPPKLLNVGPRQYGGFAIGGYDVGHSYIL